MIDDANPRPLPVLRAMVDVLDRDLLQIVARRMALVGEIAAYKRRFFRRTGNARKQGRQSGLAIACATARGYAVGNL